MDFKTPLARAQGLGAAKTGTGHWWLQRVTAVALIPLSFWLISLLDMTMNASFVETVAWLSSPLNTICVVFWVLAVFYHSALGIQIVIEDYVSTEWLKIVSVWAIKLVFMFLVLATLIAIFRIITAG